MYPPKYCGGTDSLSTSSTITEGAVCIVGFGVNRGFGVRGSGLIGEPQVFVVQWIIS